MRFGLPLATCILMLGCSFDPSGVPSDVARDAAGLGDAKRGGSGADANAPDATPTPCKDTDGDQYQVVGIPGSACGETLDCDDLDGNAYPGQPEFFDVPRVQGGYDYDCDGAETPQDTSEGGDCHWDWWDCVGTGWVGGVPACGEPGVFHVCRDDGGCKETSAATVRMKCK